MWSNQEPNCTAGGVEGWRGEGQAQGPLLGPRGVSPACSAPGPAPLSQRPAHPQPLASSASSPSVSLTLCLRPFLHLFLRLFLFLCLSVSMCLPVSLCVSGSLCVSQSLSPFPYLPLSFDFSLSLFDFSLAPSVSLTVPLGPLSVSTALYNALLSLPLSLSFSSFLHLSSVWIHQGCPGPHFAAVLTFAFEEVLQELVRCAGVLQLPGDLGVMIQGHCHIPGVPAHVDHLCVSVEGRGEDIGHGRGPWALRLHASSPIFWPPNRKDLGRLLRGSPANGSSEHLTSSQRTGRREGPFLDWVEGQFGSGNREGRRE